MNLSLATVAANQTGVPFYETGTGVYKNSAGESVIPKNNGTSENIVPLPNKLTELVNDFKERPQIYILLGGLVYVILSR